MTEGNIPKKSAEGRARLRAKKFVRRHGMESQQAKPTEKKRRKR